MKNNIVDATARLTQKRKFDQLLDGVFHSQTYSAISLANELPAACELHIELYGGGDSTGLCVTVGSDSWLVTLSKEQAVQLAKDLFSSIE